MPDSFSPGYDLVTLSIIATGLAAGPAELAVNKSGCSVRCMSMRKTSAAPLMQTTKMHDPAMRPSQRCT